MLDKSILFNLANVAVGAAHGAPPVSRQRPRCERARRQIDALRIKARRRTRSPTRSPAATSRRSSSASGSRSAPKVFLLDDPTRGVDVGAKREIYGLIREMSANGGIVLFSSTELPELIGLCDRILVVYQGRLAGELSRRGDERADRSCI